MLFSLSKLLFGVQKFVAGSKESFHAKNVSDGTGMSFASGRIFAVDPIIYFLHISFLSFKKKEENASAQACRTEAWRKRGCWIAKKKEKKRKKWKEKKRKLISLIDRSQERPVILSGSKIKVENGNMNGTTY